MFVLGHVPLHARAPAAALQWSFGHPDSRLVPLPLSLSSSGSLGCRLHCGELEGGEPGGSPRQRGSLRRGAVTVARGPTFCRELGQRVWASAPGSATAAVVAQIPSSSRAPEWWSPLTATITGTDLSAALVQSASRLLCINVPCPPAHATHSLRQVLLCMPHSCCPPKHPAHYSAKIRHSNAN